MALYTTSDYPVAPEIETLHASELASFTQCGTWGRAAQRAAIAATARAARSEAALQEPNRGVRWPREGHRVHTRPRRHPAHPRPSRVRRNDDWEQQNAPPQGATPTFPAGAQRLRDKTLSSTDAKPR